MNSLKMSIGEALLPVLTSASGFLAEHQGLVRVLGPVVLVLATAMGVFAVAVWGVNAAMAASPITWIILGVTALAAGMVVLYTQSETARKIIDAAFSAIWAVIQFGYHWVRDNWPLLLGILTGPIGLAVVAIVKNFDKIKSGAGAVFDFITSSPRMIGAALAGLGQIIAAPYVFGFNMIGRAWNATVGKIGFDIPSWVPGLGGKGFHMPRVPMLAEGGITTGPTLAMIGEGPEQEAVLPLSQLEHMINMEARSTGKVEPSGLVVSFAPGGGDSFTQWLQETIRVRFGGDVAALGQEG
ncbi:hypothetical protein [Protofrankia coriariae]|uniref:hypothetical protein n=1 Tax=Protofrankia coriariae TaxID=1562887 RepID=UPI00191095FE|nr:hypothetical protein [Protofrankia coriariae]